MRKFLTRKKCIVTLIAASAITIVLCALLVWAYSVLVNYNYNITAYADVLSVEQNGNSVTITRTNEKLQATKADIIVTSTSDGITLNNIAPTHIARRGENNYALVFSDVALSGDSTTLIFSAAVSVVHAAVSEAVSDKGLTVHYINSYVASAFDLGLLNLQSNYNNIFELAGRFYSRVVFDRTVYLLDDITIAEPITINHPCSINLLQSSLIMNADLTIHHSYAGRYFITQLDSGVSQISGNSELTVKTPKAYYDIDETIKTALLSRLKVYFNFGDYGAQIMDDAIFFANALVPKYIFIGLNLPSYYQTFGVKLDFEIAGMPLTPDIIEGLRGVNTAAHQVTITASKSGQTTKTITK